MSHYLDAHATDAYGEMRENVLGYDLRARFLDTIDRIAYYFTAGGWASEEHTATLELREWAKHLHGNAPSGTPYGSYRLTLPNGKRTRLFAGGTLDKGMRVYNWYAEV